MTLDKNPKQHLLVVGGSPLPPRTLYNPSSSSSSPLAIANSSNPQDTDNFIDYTTTTTTTSLYNYNDGTEVVVEKQKIKKKKKKRSRNRTPPRSISVPSDSVVSYPPTSITCSSPPTRTSSSLSNSSSPRRPKSSSLSSSEASGAFPSLSDSASRRYFHRHNNRKKSNSPQSKRMSFVSSTTTPQKTSHSSSMSSVATPPPLPVTGTTTSKTSSSSSTSPTSVMMMQQQEQPEHFLDANLQDIVTLISKVKELSTAAAAAGNEKTDNNTVDTLSTTLDYIRDLRQLLHDRIDEPVSHYDYSDIAKTILQVTRNQPSTQEVEVGEEGSNQQQQQQLLQQTRALLQQEGCRAMYYLRFLDGSNPLTKSMELLMGARAELHAMKVLPYEEVVQEEALVILQEYAATSIDSHRVIILTGLEQILHALIQFSDNVNIFQSGLVLLCNIAAAAAGGNSSSSSSSSLQAGMGDAIPIVLELMDTTPHCDIPAIQINACTTLTNIIWNNMENQKRFISSKEDGLSVLARSMTRFKTYVEIQESAMEVLLNLTGVVMETAKETSSGYVSATGVANETTNDDKSSSSSDKNADTDANKDKDKETQQSQSQSQSSSLLLKGQDLILDAIYKAMTSHLQVASVQIQACRLLADWSNLLLLDEYKQQNNNNNNSNNSSSSSSTTNASRNEKEELDSSQQEEKKDQDEDTEASAAPLAKEKQEEEQPQVSLSSSKSAIVVPNLVKTILKVMRLHADEYEIQFYACHILRNLARRHHVTIIAAGAMGTILVAMRDHERHYDLQEHACAALYGLLSEGSLDDSLSLASECGISTLIHTIKTVIIAASSSSLEEEEEEGPKASEEEEQQQEEEQQHQYLDVFHFGLGALACVSTTRAPNNQELIVLSSGVQVIVGVMTAHPEHPEISQYGSEILKNLSYSAEYQSAIAVSGGITAILTAMRRHGEYVGIQEFGCCTIRNFSLNDDNKKWIASEGGISIMLVAMTLYPKHSEIQAFGCEVMANLAEDPENQMIFASEHGIEEVCMIIKEHSKDRDVKEKGFTVLAQMVEARPELFTLMETGIQRAVSFRITKKETRRRLASMVDWFKVKASSRASMEALAAFSFHDYDVDGDEDSPLNHPRADAMSRLESEGGWSDAEDDSEGEDPLTDTEDTSENGDENDQTNEELLGLTETIEEEAQRSSVSRLVSWISEKRSRVSAPDAEGADDSGIENAEQVGLLSFDSEGPANSQGEKSSTEDEGPQDTKPGRSSLVGVLNWFRGSNHKESDADAEGSENEDGDGSSKGLISDEMDGQKAEDHETSDSLVANIAVQAAVDVDVSTANLHRSHPIKDPISDSDSTGDNIHVFEEGQGDDTDSSVISSNSTEVAVDVVGGQRVSI